MASDAIQLHALSNNELRALAEADPRFTQDPLVTELTLRLKDSMRVRESNDHRYRTVTSGYVRNQG
jgi:hypothetical protein